MTTIAADKHINNETPEPTTIWYQSQIDDAFAKARGTLPDHLIPNRLRHYYNVAHAALELLDTLAEPNRPPTEHGRFAWLHAQGATHLLMVEAIRAIEQHRVHHYTSMMEGAEECK